MQCPYCHGTHFVVENGVRRPCPECGGLGEVHCCDGLQEQVEGPVVTPADPGGSGVAPGSGAGHNAASDSPEHGGSGK